MVDDDQSLAAVDRRAVLQGVLTSTFVGFSGTALANRQQIRSVNADESVEPSQGNGAICEIDVDERFQTEMHLVEDPANSGREGVLHVTSNRNHTRDYACSVLTLTDRSLLIGDVLDNSMTFDYYEGRRNENAAPDEVFLVVQTSEGMHITFQHLNTERELTWQTYDVAGAIQGFGPSWKQKRLLPEVFNIESEVDLSTIDFGSFGVNFAMRIVEQIIQFLQNLRDQGERLSSPIEAYGSDGQILAVALGKGFTTQETVNDIFYDELVVETDEETTRLEWPVALSMRFRFLRQQITPSSDQTVRARLAFEQREQGLSIDEVNTDSVVLNPYTSIAPLEDVRGVVPESITQRGNQLRLTFDTGEVTDLVDGSEPTFLLTGEFVEDALSRPISFLGRDTLRFRNSG